MEPRNAEQEAAILAEQVAGLRREMIARFEAAEKAVHSALDAADRAVQKAEAASEKRFEGVNEFRSALGDQQRTLMPRSEAEQRFTQLEGKLAVIEARLSTAEGMGRGRNDTVAYVVAAISILAAITAIASRFIH